MALNNIGDFLVSRLHIAHYLAAVLGCFVAFHPLKKPAPRNYFPTAHDQMSERRHTWDFPTQGVLNVRPRTSQELRNLLDRQVFVDVFHAYPSPCKPPEGTSVTENRKYFLFFFERRDLVGILGAL